MQKVSVRHMLICPNVGLVMTRHNEIFDKIIHLTMLRHLAPLAVTVALKNFVTN